MPDETFYERLREYLNHNDHFAENNNMRITKISHNYAEAVFDADERHLNGLDIVQGGALYTLADFTFAGAINSTGVRAVGMNSSINHLKPGRGKHFKATATPLHCGKTTGVFSVDISDEAGNLIVRVTLTGMYLNSRWFE